MPFLFRYPTLDDAQMLLDWRTSPDIASKMTTQVPYDLEKQKKWLADCNARNDYVHFIIMLEDGCVPVGYLSYSQIDWQNMECSVGYYTVLEKNKRHLSAYLSQFYLDYAFYKLKMQQVFSSILSTNTRTLEDMRRRNIPLKKQPDGNFYYEQNISDFLKKIRLFPLDRTLASFPAEPFDPS